jgi:hypothetical protein
VVNIFSLIIIGRRDFWAMNKTVAAFLVGTGALILISEFLDSEGPMSIYGVSLLLLAVLFYVTFLHSKRRKKQGGEVPQLELMRDAHKAKIARSEVKARIPKNVPRRESTAAFEGSAKLGAARSMAVLVRKPRRREKILEI